MDRGDEPDKAAGPGAKEKMTPDTVFFFTFLGEKVLGIFAGHYEFARDAPQQLNDQCYMVYMGGEGGACKRRGREGENKDTQTRVVRQEFRRGPRPESAAGGWRLEASAANRHLSHIRSDLLCRSIH